MAAENNMRELFLGYFKQQQELHGDEYLATGTQLAALEKALETSGVKNPPQVQKDNKDPQVPKNEGVSRPVPRDQNTEALVRFYHEIKDCTKCGLADTRTHFVFGTGNPNADIMLIGEAPGREEDKMGKPFVGLAGKLLNKMLKAIGLERDAVFIANILKCRPPNNRDPQPAEVEQCEPHLHQQIALIQPRLILALGRISGQTLLKTNSSLADLRGRLHSYQGIPMVMTYHPAALLRNPQWKYPAWDDLRYFRNLLTAIEKGDPTAQVRFETKERDH